MKNQSAAQAWAFVIVGTVLFLFFRANGKTPDKSQADTATASNVVPTSVDPPVPKAEPSGDATATRDLAEFMNANFAVTSWFALIQKMRVATTAEEV